MQGQASLAVNVPIRARSGERVRLAFQQRWRAHLARYRPEPQAFQQIWEQTIQRHPLDPAFQDALQWEMADWARSYERFTSAAPSVS